MSTDNLEAYEGPARTTCASLSDFPAEILTTIIDNLPGSAHVCLALTSHNFYDLVISTTKKPKLNEILPRLRSASGYIWERSPTEFERLLPLLKSWVPPKCLLNEMHRWYYISRLSSKQMDFLSWDGEKCRMGSYITVQQGAKKTRMRRQPWIFGD